MWLQFGDGLHLALVLRPPLSSVAIRRLLHFRNGLSTLAMNNSLAISLISCSVKQIVSGIRPVRKLKMLHHIFILDQNFQKCLKRVQQLKNHFQL